MKIIIANSSSEPIYTQIANQLRSQIIKGTLNEGELLPSIRGLAKDLQISVITTKRSYDELEKEGFIETVPGKGSYVAVQNKEIMKEKKLKVIEDKIVDVVKEGKMMGFTKSEIIEIFNILYEEA